MSKDKFLKSEIKKKQLREFRRKVVRKVKSCKRKTKKVYCQSKQKEEK